VTVNEHESLAERFEQHRAHLRAVAYRMLGSLSQADDAAQEAWLRLSRADTSGVENLRGWLTTVVARICLDMLRARRALREEPHAHVPDPIVSRQDGYEPEHQRSWPTRSGSRSSWSSRRWIPPSGSRSCCTTCSPRRSTRSRRSSAGPRPRVELPVLVNGAAGIAVFVNGQPFSVIGFTVTHGKIVEINVLADPARLRHLDLATLTG
jgi:RNA polymerase sigma factor (sigma-70 family)